MSRAGRAVGGAFFVGAGILHFVRPRMYEQIVPPGFGDPTTVVMLSGAAEIAGGAALASSVGLRATRWWLVALLVSVFPANVYMALEPARTTGGALPGWLLWARLPLQPLLIWWIWRTTRQADPGPAPA